MPLFGPPNIDKLKAKHDVPGLIKALSYKRNDWVRKDAALALGDLGDRSAVEALIAVLEDKWVGVRQTAAKSLGKLGDARAVDPLIQLLKQVKEDTRDAATAASAVAALGEIGDARAVEALAAALKHPDRKVHTAAILALGNIYDSKALRWLVAELKRPEGDLSSAALQALQNFSETKKSRSLDPLDVSPLVSILNHNDLSICHIAATVLNRLGWTPETDKQKAWYWTARDDWEKCAKLGEPAVEPLIRVLKSADLNRRIQAALALGTIGSERAVDALVAAFGDFKFITGLADALATSGNAQAVASLSAMLVAALVARLKDADRYSIAARTLVKLYASGRLGMKEKQAILAQREVIMKGQHEDDYEWKHEDSEGRGLSSDPTDCHWDQSVRTKHRDINVLGAEFPL